MATARPVARNPYKWSFFALMALCTLLVLWVDERFLFDSANPRWEHIEPIKWLLLPHAVFGAVALVTGALQFSDRIRARRPALHRWTGRVYLLAVSIAAPLALVIGTGPAEPDSIHVEQIFQAGLWWLTGAIGFLCIRRDRSGFHKPWMMRSYAMTLIFVLSRVPDLWFDSYTDQALSDLLWSLVIVALLAPDVILTVEDLWRTRRRRYSAITPRRGSRTPTVWAVRGAPADSSA